MKTIKKPTQNHLIGINNMFRRVTPDFIEYIEYEDTIVITIHFPHGKYVNYQRTTFECHLVITTSKIVDNTNMLNDDSKLVFKFPEAYIHATGLMLRGTCLSSKLIELIKVQHCKFYKNKLKNEN